MFDKITIHPKVYPVFDLKEFCSVQPMSEPTGTVFYMDFVYGKPNEIDLYNRPFVWNKKYRTNKNTIAYIQSDGYTLYDTTVDDIKKYVFQVSNGTISTKQCDEFVKSWKVTKKSKVCLAKSDPGSWYALAGREYVIIYNPRGEIRYIYCWKMS